MTQINSFFVVKTHWSFVAQGNIPVYSKWLAFDQKNKNKKRPV